MIALSFGLLCLAVAIVDKVRQDSRIAKQAVHDVIVHSKTKKGAFAPYSSISLCACSTSSFSISSR